MEAIGGDLQDSPGLWEANKVVSFRQASSPQEMPISRPFSGFHPDAALSKSNKIFLVKGVMFASEQDLLRQLGARELKTNRG